MSGIQVAPDIEERHGFPGALRASPSPAVFAVGARATAAAAAAAVEAALGPALAAAGTLAAGRFFAEAAAARAAPLALAAARLLAEPAGAAARTIAAEAAARPGTSAARAESRATAAAREGAAQALARGGKRETTDEQLHGHDLLLSFAGSITPSIYPPRNGDLDEMARLFGADLTESLSRSGLRRWGRAAANRPRSARARRARPAQRSHAPAA